MHQIFKTVYKIASIENDYWNGEKQLHQSKERLKFNKKASSYLLDCACSTLSEAKAVHDIPESHYINAMNFDKLKEFAEKFCKKIL